MGHRTVLDDFLNTVALNKDSPAITIEYFQPSLSLAESEEVGGGRGLKGVSIHEKKIQCEWKCVTLWVHTKTS